LAIHFEDIQSCSVVNVCVAILYYYKVQIGKLFA
jgi:hypothetical protein